MRTFDAIVVGVGGVGSAALYHFARNGLSVLGLDRFPTAHAFGSSHGQTRLIRQAYFEHPDYVPMLQRAYRMWEELGQAWGRSLYREVGVLQVGPPNGRILPGVLQSARQHQLEIDQLTAREVGQRFPGFVVPDELSAVFERRAGFLYVEEAIRAHTALALQSGAVLQTGEAVREITPQGDTVVVRTDRETYHVGHVVLTAGSWANDFLGKLKIPFDVLRKSLYWYDTNTAAYQADQGAPGFIIEGAEGNFYGFPQIDEMGVKVAEHSNGIPVANPLQFDRTEDATETSRVQNFLKLFMPGVSDRQMRFETCLYTLSPDRNFVVDTDPDNPRIAFAAGLSGHGFKFANVLGEVLVEMSLGRPTSAPASFLSASRPGLRVDAR